MENEPATYVQLKSVNLTLLREESPEHRLLNQVEKFRIDATRRLNPATRSELGQFLTPSPVARLMASMLAVKVKEIHLLEPGAGVGSLIAASVVELATRKVPPVSIKISAYEIDVIMQEYLHETLRACYELCQSRGIVFSSAVHSDDFISAASTMLISDGLFAAPRPAFNCAILNPPYKKINSNSEAKAMLRGADIDVSNAYAAFVALSVRLVAPGGEIVAITPRSFCNGPYFFKYRQLLFSETDIRRIHVFDSRTAAFKDDDVLQENIIFRAVKTKTRFSTISISSSDGPADNVTVRQAKREEIINPSDKKQFLRIIPHDNARRTMATIEQLAGDLEDLGITVSTGRVVDFRAKEHLCANPGLDTVPLIYPGHFSNGFIQWPLANSKKPNAIRNLDITKDLLVPSERYVLVKRFSAKEEKRRIVAVIYEPSRFNASFVGLENHLNYFHCQGRGLPEDLAHGLSAYLNSTIVEDYFRNFNGHTQVNATDLRNIPVPDSLQLENLGKFVRSGQSEAAIDFYLHSRIIPMVAEGTNKRSNKKRRLEQARQILCELELPAKQTNERSALTLLALLNIVPSAAWADAGAPLRGITELMNFFSQHYGKEYKPNTREDVRRQTMHQFVSAGLVHANPDKPERAINSPDFVYQIDKTALDLIKTFDTPEWSDSLATYLSSIETLKTKYAQLREMNRIPVSLSSGKEITLSPGGQNVLIEKILTEFCPRFTPDSHILYIGDTDAKWAYYDNDAFSKLAIDIDPHGKMPDVIIYYKSKGWLVLIEAVTSHGPVNPKRHDELRKLFSGSSAGLVYVTAFLSRRAMVKYLNDISWETEVWVADAPSHLIHFNGERFLGPY